MQERTITQNSALYLAQHRTVKQRNSIFQRMRAAKIDRPLVLRRPTFGEAYLVPRFFSEQPSLSR
jgi:hypothetical protein